MRVHDAPSSALAQTSPLVVPKYTPTGSPSSTVIAWRFTVNHARSGSPASQPRPRLARVAGDVHGGLPVGARARPHVGAVHREHPRGVGIARMQLDREADVADVARHVVADAHPPALGPVHAVDAAVVLLVQAVGPQRMQPHAVRVVAELGLGIGKERRERNPR